MSQGLAKHPGIDKIIHRDIVKNTRHCGPVSAHAVMARPRTIFDIDLIDYK
jgi:hypothetical protein